MKEQLILAAAILAAALVIYSIAVVPQAKATKTVICSYSDGCGVEDDGCGCSYQLALRLPLPHNTTLSISSNNQTSLVDELTRQMSLHPSDMIKMQINSTLDKSSQSKIPINDTTLLKGLK